MVSRAAKCCARKVGGRLQGSMCVQVLEWKENKEMSCAWVVSCLIVQVKWLAASARHNDNDARGVWKRLLAHTFLRK